MQSIQGIPDHLGLMGTPRKKNPVCPKCSRTLFGIARVKHGEFFTCTCGERLQVIDRKQESDQLGH